MSAGIVSLPAHKKSYQLGVLATPVQIRTDPYPSELPLAVPQRVNRTKLTMAGAVLPFE